jgi:hypothetical protein
MLLRAWLVFLRAAGCVEAAEVDKKQAKATADPYGMTTKKQATEAATIRGFPADARIRRSRHGWASFLELQAAAYLEGFACDPTGLRGCHEGYGVGDVFGFAETAERGA